MSASAGKKKIPYIIGCLAAVLGVLGVLILGLTAYSFIRYRQIGNHPADASQSRVIISQPGNMAQFPAGTAIQVEVDAIGQQPFTSTELWINGILEGVEAIPVAGRTSITTNFWWTPPEGGNYSLVARTINQDNGTASSPAVIVFITPPDYGDQPDPEAGKTHPVVLPAPPAGQTSPQPPAIDDAPAPAGEWQGSPGDWLTGINAGSTPAAPELVTAADGCSIRLNIHDLSDNEEGFALYRQTTGSPDWVHAADLASHLGKGWLEYQESNLAGGITYYVAAFNNQGETSSNLALVNIDPQACPPSVPLIEIPSLHLKAGKLSIDEKISGMYCYIHLGGRYWSRWPELGFLKSSETGQKLPPLVKPLLLANLDDMGFNSGPKFQELDMECWGWQGPNLIEIGKIKANIDLAAPQEIHLDLSAVTIDILPELISDIKSKFFELGPSFQTPSIKVADQYSVETLGYVPESDQMPYIVAWESDDPGICKDHMLNPADKELFCAPLPGFVNGPGGSYPQKYLVWYVLNGGCKAYPEKECFSLDWWENFAKYNPDPYNPGVRFMVRNRLDSSSNYDVPVDTDQWAWRIHPDVPPTGDDKCLFNYRWLKVYLDVRSSAGEITSSPSNEVTVICPQPLGDTVDVEVQFYSLTLDNIDDGSGDTTADAVNGIFGTVPAGKPAGVRMGYANIKDCAYYFANWEPSGGMGCTSFDVGAYLLEDIPLCSLGGYGCQNDAEFNLNNNKIVVTLRDQDTLQLFVHLIEYDNGSDNDTVCDQKVWLGPWSLDTWASLKDANVWLNMNDNGYASCKVHVMLNTIKPGQ